MTDDEIIAVVSAHRDGKKIECRLRRNIDWSLVGSPVWDFHTFDYRVAPEPKLRPWKPEEVPVGALMRRKGYLYLAAIIEAGDYRVFYGKCGDASYSDALEFCEHSTDGGATWYPCGVMEVQS